MANTLEGGMPEAGGGQGGLLVPPDFADQLTYLNQSGQIMPPHYYSPLQIFRPFDIPEGGSGARKNFSLILLGTFVQFCFKGVPK